MSGGDVKPATYRTFVRTWWVENSAWPNGLEPCPGRRSYRLGSVHQTIEAARAECKEFNRINPPGRYSRKMEFEEVIS